MKLKWAILAFLVLAGCGTFASVKTTAPTVEGQQTVTHEQVDPTSGKVTGRTTTTTTGAVKGSGSSAIGDKVDQELKSDPAMVTIDGLTATSGGLQTNTKAKGDQSLWIMLACLLAGAGCLAAGIKLLVPPSTNVRGGIGFAVAGGVLIAIAIYPTILLWGLAGIVVVGAGFYFTAEQRAVKGTEGLRASLAAAAKMGKDEKATWVDDFVSHASDADRLEYLKWRNRDRLDLPPI